MSQDRGPIAKVETRHGPGDGEAAGMPLKVIVLAELTPRDLETGRSTSIRRRIRIDRQSFDEVMTKLLLKVQLAVPDRLTSSKDPLILEIALPDMKAFRPDAIAAQIPATRDLLALRAALTDLRSAKVRVADVKTLLGSLKSGSPILERVRRALEESAGSRPADTPWTPEETRAGNGLDALLAKVEPPAGASGAAARSVDLSRLDALIHEIARSESRADRVDGRAVDAAVSEIDAALSRQVEEVLHAPELRRLEAAWRGLRFLIDRTDFEKPIRVEILATPMESLIEEFDALVYTPESQGISEEAVSLILVDGLFENTPGDLELLRALSERGAALSAPVVSSVGTAFLGLARADDLMRKTSLREIFAGPDFAKWVGLREAGPSRWLGLAFNRFLLRPAYGPGSLTARSFAFVESIPSGAEELRTWGNAGWALTTLAVRSFARIGWCTDLMGQRASGAVEDLPVREIERPGAETKAFPLEVVVSDAIERDLSNNGLMALSASLGSDRAYLRFAPTVHAPQHYQDPGDRARARLQSTLPFQLFVGRVINYAMLLEGILVPGRTAEQAAAAYDRALRSLLASAGPVPADAVRVGVVPNEEDPSRQDLHLKIRWPGFQSLPGAGEIDLRWPLA